MVWFPDSWFYLSRKKFNLAMFSCFKKSEKSYFLQREVYLLAWCLMLNWSRRHAFIYATKTSNLWFFFYSFWRVFAEKYVKKYSTGNEEWIQWLCTPYFEHFISSLADKTNAPWKNEQYCYYSLTVEDTETFAKLLFWSDSWVTDPFSTIDILLLIYIWWQ